MRSLKASDFKQRCLKILDEVDRTGEAIVIMKRGRAVARLVPAVGGRPYPQNSLRGTVEILGDIVSPALPEGARSPRRCTVTRRTAS